MSEPITKNPLRDSSSVGKEYIGLQYLRGIAAMMVVAYHLLPRLARKYAWPEFPVEFLASGVDIFFVISGFIIWLTTEKAGIDRRQWLLSRLIRIFPLYWIASCGMLLQLWLMARPLPGGREILDSFLLIPHLSSRTGDFAPILQQGWSLYYEFFFYVLLALLLFIQGPLRRLAILVGLFTVLVCLRFVIDKGDPIQFRMTSPLLFEFVAGILVALVVRTRFIQAHRFVLGTASLLAAAAFLLLVSHQVYPGPRIIYFGIPAALTVFGVVCLEDAWRRRVVHWLKKVGDSSYSLYLSHTLVYALAGFLFESAGVSRPETMFVLRFLVCVAMGWCIYRIIERPLLEWTRSRYAKVAPGRVRSSPASS